MNSKDFFERVALRAGLSPSSVKKVFFEAKSLAKECVCKGETVKISGFFSIRLKERKPRLCTNLQTGRKFLSPAKKVVVVKLSKAFERV